MMSRFNSFTVITINAALLLITTLLAGCFGSDKPSTKEVQSALEEYISLGRACVMPAVEPSFTIGELDAGYSATVQALKPMVDAGLMDVKEQKKRFEEQKISSISSSVKYFFIEQSYNITAFGTKFFKKVDDNRGKFCYGQARLLSVDEVSEPMDMNGKTVVHVQFTEQMSQNPDWSTEKVLSAFPDSLIAITEPKKQAAVLVKTPNGYKHRDLVE